MHLGIFFEIILKTDDFFVMETLDEYARLEERSDISLLKDIACGNVDAFYVVMDKYLAAVSRTTFRILCDRADSEYVTVKVFGSLWNDVLDFDDRFTLEEWLLRKACFYSRIRITRRRILRIFGYTNDLFVNTPPTADDKDDFLTKQAWELYCRATADMSPLQSACYALCQLDGLSEETVSKITGMTRFRIGLAFKRAKDKVRNQLSHYNKEDDFDRYNDFLRKVAFNLTDDGKLRKMISIFVD